ncbi:MAG TPA: outer-membrane lipoprotein carrier protein LolA [Microvirga sp.]|nr:outer-membrane lipoprotein carrier protein LolA [Microvirga sp.]
MMLLRYLRYILGVGAVLAWLTPALAQQAGDPLTRLLDSFFKPPAGQSGNAQPGASEQPRPAPRAAPAPRAQPAARAQQPSQAEPGKAPPQKAAAPKQEPKPAQPQLQAQPEAPKAEPKAEAKPPTGPSDGVAEAKPEPPRPAAAPPAGASEQPKARPVQAAEPPRSDPKPVEAAAKPATPPASVREAPKAAEAPPAPTPPATPVAAKVQTPSPIPASPAAALDQVNSYFNGIDQLTAYFVQKNPNGQQVEGTLAIKRPGILRFAYAPPSALEIVSDGRSVAIRDKKLGTNDVYPVGQTPLKFLLQENVDLGRDTKVRDVQVGRDGLVTVRFDDSATFGGTSRITLRFDARANALRQWIIVDSQGYETSVTLSNLNVTHKKDARATN